MSKTFTSRPTQTRARGTTRGASTSRGRGGLQRSATGPQEESTSDSGRGRGSGSGSSGGNFGGGSGRGTGFKSRARGTNTTGRGGRGIDLVPSNSTSQNSPGRGMDHNPSYGGGYRRNSGNLGMSGEGEFGSPRRQNRESRQNDNGQRGSHEGAFTVFAPDEKKRQQMLQGAQHRMDLYERQKQANSQRSFHHVERLGGDTVSEDLARTRQAREVRDQKFNRLKRQEEQKAAKKMIEEKEIDEKRREQRRKAEQNAEREKRVNADEIRRQREGFLRQFEQRAVEAAASSTAQSPPQEQKPSLGHGAGACNPRMPAGKTWKPSESNAQSKDSSNSWRVTSIKSGYSPSSVKTEEPVSVKTEALDFANSDSEQEDTEADATRMQDLNQEVNDDLGLLTSMFPNYDMEYLTDLLFQMGSVDGVLSALDMEG